MNVSAAETTPSSTTANNRALTLAGLFAAYVLLSPGLLTISRVNVMEAASGVFLAALLLALIVAFRGTVGLASSMVGSAALAAVACVTILQFSPLSLRAVLQQGGKELPLPALLHVLLPALVLAALPLARHGKSGANDAFLAAKFARVNVWLVGCVALAGGLLLSGYPLVNISRLAILLAAVLLSWRTLWALASHPVAAKLFAGGIFVVVSANAASGLKAYFELRTTLSNATMEALAKRFDHANTALNQAVRQNQRVQSRPLKIEIEKQFGTLRELQNDTPGAIHHWHQYAQLQGTDFGSTPAARRILVRNGDSLLGWRQLVHKGFSAVLNDDIVDGILALGDKPDSDARASLLAALLAWEKNASESERRARLEKVIAKRANDVTANNLLAVLGRTLPNIPFWVGEDLLVGDKASRGSVNGTIEDLGKTDTIVFLTEGQWECRVRARGTPLNEEWPILRVEIDGVEALRARVDKPETFDLPFSFAVKNNNLYRVRFIFENQLKLFQGSLQAQRGLVVEGIYFQRAK